VTDFDWSIPAAALTLTAKYLLARKSAAGWAVEIVAGLFWNVLSYQSGMLGWFVMSLIIQAMNVRGLVLWSRKNSCK
jgi:hypothetical protein